MQSDDPAAHYDRVTEAWHYLLGEDLHYGWFNADEPLELATAELTRQMALVTRPTGRVLDVGCGTGNPACLLAESHACEVTGISTSEDGLARARKRIAQRGLADRVRVEKRDGEDNGFPDTSFDRVWVMESSHLMLHKERLIVDCARVLKPGGCIALCDVILRRDLARNEVLRHAKQFDLLRRVFGRAKLETLDFYSEQAEKAGLQVELARDISAETRPTFARWRENARIHRDTVVKCIGEADWQRFADSCDVLDDFWGAGILGYGLCAWAKAG